MLLIYMAMYTKFTFQVVINMVRWDKEFAYYDTKTITYNNITMWIPNSNMFNLKYNLKTIDNLLTKNQISQQNIDIGFISFLIYNEVIPELNKYMPQRNIIVSALEYIYSIENDKISQINDIIMIEDNDISGEPLFYIVGPFDTDNAIIIR